MKDYNIYIVDDNYFGCTLKDYLRKELKISHRNLIRLRKNSSIYLNGQIESMNKMLSIGDKIEIILNDEQSQNVVPQDLELDIIYEDDYIIAINKSAGMPVHPTKRHFTDTVANGLAYYWLGKGKGIKIRPIIRLDKDTSGILIFAKNSHIQHLMIVENAISLKEYIAIVEGYVPNNEGIIDQPIGRESPNSIKRIVTYKGQKATTTYKTVLKNEKASLLNVQLQTGRTHQIRVHMAFIGHPILGDDLYGGNRDLIKRQALHAKTIGFTHPITGEYIIISAKIPKDIKELCNKLGSNSNQEKL